MLFLRMFTRLFVVALGIVMQVVTAVQFPAQLRSVQRVAGAANDANRCVAGRVRRLDEHGRS